MSLSQNDFRKLLATPRPQSSGAEAAKPAKFAKPAPPQRKPANDSARIVPAKFRKKPDPETEDGPKFRDRAKERRQGNNPDFADSEDILARLTAIEEREQGENADIKTALYQQSKYLGGDEKHTHLVKGLDFALLKKVRSEMQKTDDQATKEQEAEEYLERVANETVAATSSKPIFNSGFAELIHTAAMDANAKMIPQKNELFRAGRMAFCWDLRGDDIPTTVIRSKAEVKDELKPSTADSEIVIGKIVEILASVRLGTRNKESMTAGEKKALKKKEREEKLKAELEGTEAAYADAMDDGDDIFADVGRDYELEVVDKSTGERVKTDKVSTGPKTYFAKPILDSDDECDPGTRQTLLVAAGVSNPLNSANNDEDNMFADFAGEAGKNLSSSTAKTGADTMSVDAILKSSAAMLNELQGAGTAEKLITAEGIPSKPKKSGLSLSRLANNYGEEDPEFDQYYDSDDADEEEEAAADANQLDQGIKARKKTQLRRFDFDTEEEFQAYKDSQVVMPKTAYQFGVKNADGRKSRKELSGGGGRGGHDQEKKLDKEMKQLDKMMGVKYGISLTGASEGKKRGGNESGGSGSKKKRI